MKTFVVDTNILLRFLLNDVPKQTEEAKKQIRFAKEGKIKLIIHPVIIFETIYALNKAYGFPREQVVDGLKKLIAFKYIEVLEREVIQEALDLFLIKGLSFVDCFLYRLGNKLHAEVFTFDKKLNQLI